MKAVRKRLTYANVMSSLAVFLVLGGATAVAANQLGKNSVGPKQLKKNAVTTAKLKKNAVTAAKIKPGAVTGAKINEASLGTVPSATNATNAVNASVAANLAGYTHGKVRLTPTLVAGYSEGVEGAPETTVLTAGPISITAKCFSYSTTTYAMFFIRSSTEGTAFDGYNDYTYDENFIGPNTKASERELVYESSSGDYSDYEAEDGFFAAMAADGTTVRGNLQIGVKTGNLANTGPFGPGNVCLMAGDMFVL